MGQFREAPQEKIKAIFLAAGSDGDIHPHLGLGRELMARGHKVLFLTSFDYIDMARECGFDTLSVIGPEDKRQFDHAESLGATAQIESRSRFFSRKVAEIFDLVASQLDERSIIVCPPFGYAVAKLLHLRYGVPYVSTVLSPASLCSLIDPPAFKSGEWVSRLPYAARKLLFHGIEQFVIDPVFRIVLRGVIQELDLPKPHRVMREWCYSPRRILGLFPDWFCPKPDDWPPQLALTGFTLFNQCAAKEAELPPGLCRFLTMGSPPVVFTPGTETRNARTFFEAALKAAEETGSRGVVLTRLADQLPSLPATMCHESYAPLNLLIPKAAVVVHHGGIGTTAQCLRAGIPQLVVPGRLDQFDNAQHVERLGCGRVQKSHLDSRAMAENLRYLLTSPQVRDACRSVQIRMEAGATACSRAADFIEETFYAATSTSSLQRIDASF
jgi:rhamnosyltransferase subunit B